MISRDCQLNSKISKCPLSMTLHRPSRTRTTLLTLYLVASPPFRYKSLPLTPRAGFSFSGEVREPFPSVIAALRDTTIPVLSVDAPSSWNIETGPPADGPGKGFQPPALISLTAPKPLVKYFKGRHFLGGRYVQSPILNNCCGE